MNDNKFDRYVEAYGNSLAIEAGITGILKSMASTKLRFILSHTLERRKYREYVEAGKFSFLKTKSVFNDCMESAGRFGWERTYL